MKKYARFEKRDPYPHIPFAEEPEENDLYSYGVVCLIIAVVIILLEVV
jgi:hypothetical protein